MNILQCPSTINSNFFFCLPRAIFLIPSLGLDKTQEAPQQIIIGFSCGLDIKGVRREEERGRGPETQDSKHWLQYVRGESRTCYQAEQIVLRTKSLRGGRQLNLSDC